ncbi:MAG: DUF4956 domain-containing protein [Bacilli bacterium]
MLLTSFTDIFKASFLENQSSITPIQATFTILFSFLIGLFIFQIYKKTYHSVVYTKSFNTSLIMMTMITALVIMTVTSNIVLSLGMVGALSIVRFRAAVKDPMDIVFMFWAITIGIICGTGYYLLAIAGSVAIGFILVVFSHYSRPETPYLLLVSMSTDEAEQKVQEAIKKSVKKYFIRSKTVEENQIELTVELRFKDNELSFVNGLKVIEGVKNCVLVSNNEYSN